MKISMNLGPQKTNTAGFKGFGMKMSGSASSSSAPGRPQGPVAAGSSRSSAAAKAKAAFGGAAALFRESLEDDDETKKQSAAPVWSKPTVEAVQAQRQAEALVAVDPTVFQYDEVIDDVKRDLDIEVPSQQVRTDVLTQKKRTGLVLREGAEACRAGTKREAKYIEKVITATDRRKVEAQIVEDRLLKKEQDAREGREVFVTSGFKEELKRRKKFEDELEEQELRDLRKDATKMEDGKGFADFHRNLLGGGLASARGGEKIKEQTAVESYTNAVSAGAASAKPQDESVKMEEDVKEPLKKEEDDDKAKIAKTEEDEKKPEEHGVQDVKAPEADPGTKAAKALQEQEQRAEKAMSAKERFLARKKAAAEATS